MSRGLIGLLLLTFLNYGAGAGGIVYGADTGAIVAWVTQCNGNWEDRTQPNHYVTIPCKGVISQLWIPLTRQSKLALVSHKPKDWVEIRIARTGEKHRFDCSDPGQCDPPPLPFARLVPESEPSGVLRFFLDSPSTAYARVRLMLSRSSGKEAGRMTADHALATEGSPIPLRDLLSPSAPAGDYLLEVCAFNEKNGCDSGSKPIGLKWQPGASANWPAVISSGLYEIVLDEKTSDGVIIRTPDRGLLLVVPRREAAVALERVSSGEHLFLKDWKDKPEGDLMFRALLLALASRSR